MSRITLVIGFLVLSTGLFVDPAMAHGDLIATSPFEGQTVGGELTTLQLVFNEPVEVESIELFDDGEPVRASTKPSSPNVILVDVEAPLTDGLYRLAVRHLSLDGDTVEVLLNFSYLESAPEALSVVSVPRVPQEGDSRRVWPFAIAGAALALGAGVVAKRWLRLRRLQQSH